MANKYQLITELYRTTLLSVTETPQAWKAFLRSACNSYKCPFDEQVLIYAQKPEAVAVLEMEKWNTLFGRWVNKGATGIAVFEEKNGSSGLKYYFDVADTHESRHAKPVPVWQMEQAFETSIAESLENNFGTLAEKESFPQAVLSAGRNLMADNIADYLVELVNTTADVETVDRFPKLVENSISYMALARMGFPADEYIPDSAFAGIARFDSVKKINCLGTAVSDIAETELRVVAKTVGQFFAKNRGRAYDESGTKEKKGALHMEVTYRTERGVRIPNLTIPQQEEIFLGKYAQLRKAFLKEHRRAEYTTLKTTCRLTQHLAETEQNAKKMAEQIITKMAQEQKINEEMKEKNPLEWTAAMNNLKHSAEETVLRELIYK